MLKLQRVANILAGAGSMSYPTHNGFINIDIPIPDFQVVAAIRVSANPSFVVDVCPLIAEIGQGH